MDWIERVRRNYRRFPGIPPQQRRPSSRPQAGTRAPRPSRALHGGRQRQCYREHHSATLRTIIAAYVAAVELRNHSYDVESEAKMRNARIATGAHGHHRFEESIMHALRQRRPYVGNDDLHVACNMF